jgi:hypothetical protein
MKILFFLAVLANLVFFLWQYNAGAFQQPSDRAEPLAVEKQIWLVSELEQKPAIKVAVKSNSYPAFVGLRSSAQPTGSKITATTLAHVIAKMDHDMLAMTEFKPLLKPKTVPAQATKAVAIKTTPTAVASISTLKPAEKTFFCYQISTLANKSVVANWVKRQAKEITLLKPIKENEPMVADYLIYYPTAGSIEKTRENIALLKEQGVTELFVIKSGEFKNAISLGVFKNQARAIRQQQNLIHQGIQAQLAKRYKSAAMVYLQIKTEKKPAQLLAMLKREVMQPKLELLSKCD